MTGVHFDWTITLGNVAQIFVAVAVAASVWTAFKTKIEMLIRRQAELLSSLQSNFEKHEAQDERMFQDWQRQFTELVAQVSRLVGQWEVLRHERPSDRRQG